MTCTSGVEDRDCDSLLQLPHSKGEVQQEPNDNIAGSQSLHLIYALRSFQSIKLKKYEKPIFQ